MIGSKSPKGIWGRQPGPVLLFHVLASDVSSLLCHPHPPHSAAPAETQRKGSS